MRSLQKASHKLAPGERGWDGKLSIEACGRGETFLLANLLVKRFGTRRDSTRLFCAPFDEKWFLIVCWAGWRLCDYIIMCMAAVGTHSMHSPLA